MEGSEGSELSVGNAAAGVNVKVRAGVCVVAYTRVIDRGPLGSFLRFARGRATNCILANSILLGTLPHVYLYTYIDVCTYVCTYVCIRTFVHTCARSYVRS